MKTHERFARSLVKEFGRVESKKILAFMLENGDKSIRNLAEESLRYLQKPEKTVGE